MCDRKCIIYDLQLPARIEEKIFWFDVTMSNALAMQIRETRKDLLKATLHFTRRHSSFLDSPIEVATGTELHHLAPMFVLILNQINGFDDINVVQC